MEKTYKGMTLIETVKGKHCPFGKGHYWSVLPANVSEFIRGRGLSMPERPTGRGKHEQTAV